MLPLAAAIAGYLPLAVLLLSGAAVASTVDTVAGLSLLSARFVVVFVPILFATMTHVPASILDFGGVACKIWFTSFVNASTS
ncbi:MAG: hypothetical protein ABJQ90_10685 [Parasphingorhabdus sp.]